MRTALIVSGGLLMVVGLIFFLQGINVLPGSFMTGQRKWAVYGSLMIIAGIVLATLSRRRTISE